MGVFHVLADGSRPTDITGHIVRLEDAPTFYQVMRNITRKANSEKQSNTYDKKEVRVC